MWLGGGGREEERCGRVENKVDREGKVEEGSGREERRKGYVSTWFFPPIFRSSLERLPVGEITCNSSVMTREKVRPSGMQGPVMTVGYVKGPVTLATGSG